MDFYKLSDFKRKNFSKATNELYNLTDFNNDQYPDYLNWFYQTNIPRILNSKGEILFALDGFMLKGLVILKNTSEEKKVCTLMIDEPYRNQRLGSQLLEKSFNCLGTDKPIITIPESKISQFQHFINKYDWKESGIIKDYYSKEISFNEINYNEINYNEI